MQPAELRRIRADLGLSAEVFGRLVGTSGRNVRYWEAGDRSIPGPAALLIRLIVEHPAVLAWLRECAGIEPVSNQSAKSSLAVTGTSATRP